MHTPTTSTRSQDARAVTSWRLDPEGSLAEFRVPHFWGLVTVTGRFDRLDGRLDTDDHNTPRRIELTIDAASLTTRNRRRDRHLRSADFFDVDHYPEASFRSTAIRPTEDGSLHVSGVLSAAAGHVALELEPTVAQSGDELSIDVRTTVDQRHLGITWSPLGMTRSPVTVHVHAVLRPEQ
jgi:polyisoprenoid-binding protein YceI